MLFTDPIFLFLVLPLACVLFYWITPRYGQSAGLGALLVISLAMYSGWGVFYFSLLMAAITVNFISAAFLLLVPDERTLARRTALALGQLYNFGTLAWFKYRFFFDFAGGGAHHAFSAVDFAIPIGISFYTFQQATFLVDAYHRDASVVAFLGDMRGLWGKLRGYVHHAFFVSFFPHIVIGPILYLSEFQPQVENAVFGRVRRRNLEIGIALIAIGFFKKTVIADNVSYIANSAFGAIDVHFPISALGAWAGALAYYVQLYFDFSGYSDMALGIARLFGVRFPFNFYSPLKAVGIMDFYRRWHITLTRVISRFVYMPMSVWGARVAIGNRMPRIPMRMLAQWIPLLLNFEIIALWHGARYTFIVFGLLHGTWYILESEIRATKIWKNWRKRTSGRLRAILGRMIFTVPMVLTFALFRSSSVANFGYLLSRMFSTQSILSTRALGNPNFKYEIAAFGLGCAVLWLMPNSMELLRRYRPGIKTYENDMYVPQPLRFAWRPNLRWALFSAGLIVIALYFVGRQPPFLYMGF